MIVRHKDFYSNRHSVGFFYAATSSGLDLFASYKPHYKQ